MNQLGPNAGAVMQGAAAQGESQGLRNGSPGQSQRIDPNTGLPSRWPSEYQSGTNSHFSNATDPATGLPVATGTRPARMGNSKGGGTEPDPNAVYGGLSVNNNGVYVETGSPSQSPTPTDNYSEEPINQGISSEYQNNAGGGNTNFTGDPEGDFRALRARQLAARGLAGAGSYRR